VIEQRFEREPTHEELAEYLGISVDDIKSANTASIRQSSLDAPFEEGEEGTLLDVLRNNDSTAADTLLENVDSLKIELRRLLSTLSDRKAKSSAASSAWAANTTSPSKTSPKTSA
jgi:RNA polymerase primary sigma factor